MARLQACGSMTSSRATMETHGVPIKITGAVVQRDSRVKIPTTQEQAEISVATRVVVIRAVTLVEEAISNSVMDDFQLEIVD